MAFVEKINLSLIRQFRMLKDRHWTATDNKSRTKSSIRPLNSRMVALQVVNNWSQIRNRFASARSGINKSEIFPLKIINNKKLQQIK